MSLRHQALVAALPPGFSLTLVDVGSAGGIHSRWTPFRKVVSAILFDPREAAPSGSLGPGQDRTYPIALGPEAGEATLHLTRLANMSSFLEPDAAAFERFGRKAADATVVATEQVRVEALDAIASADGVRTDILKIDTQGSELLVLEGAQQALGTTLLAEIEVSFLARYHGQPLFADVERYMADRGFELIDLIELKRYRAANRLHLRNLAAPGAERSGRLAYANAIFARPERWIVEAAGRDQGATLLRAICAFTAYRKIDIAARLLDLAGDSVDHRARAGLAKAVQTIARPWSAPRQLAASVATKLGLRRAPK